jgi:hypothetical protein
LSRGGVLLIHDYILNEIININNEMNKCAKLLDHKIITKILSVVQVLKQLIVLFLRPHVFEVFVLTLLLVG